MVGFGGMPPFRPQLSGGGKEASERDAFVDSAPFSGEQSLDLSLVMERGSTGSVAGQTATMPLRRAQPGYRRVFPSGQSERLGMNRCPMGRPCRITRAL